MTVAGTLVMGGVAFADTLQDTISDDGTGLSLVASPTSSGTAGIRLLANSGGQDPDAGCNIDAGEAPLKLDVVTPVGVTATPDPLFFNACGNEYTTVTFTASADAVSGTATVSFISGPAGGGTYVNQVAIPITVTRPNTAPVVSVTGVAHNATYQKSSVPTPGCSVVDAEDTGESATPQVTGGAYDALGAHTVTCSYTDKGATPLTGTATASYTVVRDTDTTAPVIGYALNPADPTGQNGWYTGDVSLNWTVTEADSPETLTKDGCGVQNVTVDQAATTYTCAAASEGGTADESVTIKRDSNGPVVSYDGVVSGDQGSNGWYTSPVSVQFNATDALSGPATANATVTTSGDGSAVSVGSPAFTDGAGNITPAGNKMSPTFKIDTHAPNAPTVSLSVPPNAAGWHNRDVTVRFASAGDNGPSGGVTCTSDIVVATEGAAQLVSGTCTDAAGNTSLATTVTVDLDETGPVVSYDRVVSGARGAGDWYTSDVTVRFNGTDTLSGPATSSKDVTTSGDGSAVTVGSPEFTDVAGNTTPAGNKTSPAFKIDQLAPTAPTFDGPDLAASYYFGAVPAAPTCSSTDATSGVASCVVTGHSTAVGNHTYIAKATDNAGHTSTTKHEYVVLAWSTKGYYAPVDMGGVWNGVKGGSTVPLKFEVFAAAELTSTTAVKSFATRAVACPGSTALVDEIETVLTGATSLRYDTTGGQFIQNWQTPKKPGTCAVATTTMQDGSTISANFLFR